MAAESRARRARRRNQLTPTPTNRGFADWGGEECDVPIYNGLVEDICDGFSIFSHGGNFNSVAGRSVYSRNFRVEFGTTDFFAETLNHLIYLGVMLQDSQLCYLTFVASIKRSVLNIDSKDNLWISLHIDFISSFIFYWLVTRNLNSQFHRGDF